MDKKKLLIGISLVLTLALFLIATLKPIIYQTVGFTYDQGRDFLKAAEIVMERKPTFIGPTTGISGLYHGAWWFYVLTIPFVLFRGAPIGYYYFNLFIQVASFVILFMFIKKYLNTLTAFLFLLIITTSPYFIFIALFVGNNIMVIPTLLVFLIVNYLLLEKKLPKHLIILSLLDGLLLGLAGEFELSFGIFLIPTYFLAIIIFSQLRRHFANIKYFGLFLFGLLIAFAPRMLFEVKHHFEQTKILLSFVMAANKSHEVKPYWNIVQERFALFRDFYYGSIFTSNWIGIIFLIFAIVALIYIVKKKIKFQWNSFGFMVYLIGALFFLSTLYKESFWHNYYEGIQYVFIFALAILLSANFKIKRFPNIIRLSLIGIVVISYLASFVPSVLSVPKKEGLAIQTAAVNYILDNEKTPQNYCVRIYTPPVIPHTYNYLFLYNKLSRKTNLPQTEWVNKHCWFIVEKDEYADRQKIWTDANFPVEFSSRQVKSLPNVDVIRYQLK